MELRAMKRPALWVAYATTMVTTAAYMGTFGYLGALLLDVSGVAAAWLPAVLTLFGVGAFVGLTIEAELPITTRSARSSREPSA